MELQRIKKDDCDITSEHFLGIGVVWCCSANTISLIGRWLRCKTSILSVNEVGCPLGVKRAESSCISVHHHRLLLWFALCKRSRVSREQLL